MYAYEMMYKDIIIQQVRPVTLGAQKPATIT